MITSKIANGAESQRIAAVRTAYLNFQKLRYVAANHSSIFESYIQRKKLYLYEDKPESLFYSIDIWQEKRDYKRSGFANETTIGKKSVSVIHYISGFFQMKGVFNFIDYEIVEDVKIEEPIGVPETEPTFEELANYCPQCNETGKQFRGCEKNICDDCKNKEAIAAMESFEEDLCDHVCENGGFCGSECGLRLLTIEDEKMTQLRKENNELREEIHFLEVKLGENHSTIKSIESENDELRDIEYNLQTEIDELKQVIKSKDGIAFREKTIAAEETTVVPEPIVEAKETIVESIKTDCETEYTQIKMHFLPFS